jgi:phospholipase A-2-activating protein
VTYEELISSSAINSSQIGDVKKSDLKPESTLLERRGKKEGEIAMVKHSITGDVEAHQWSSAEGKWIKIGSVVDAVGSGRKQLYEGKEYDYVFDVDVEEGRPPLKLPYNATRACQYHS